MRTRLTDDQVWTILNTPGMTDADLASALGVKESTVHNRRWLLKRSPWSCSVRYAPCRHCGEIATFRGQSARHAYHAQCRPIALRAIQRAIDAERLITPERVDRLHRWHRDAQQRSIAGATNAGARWTEDDDAYLLEHWDDGYEALAADLCRTVGAINLRRVVLKRRGQRTQDRANAKTL
jgi:hypothetical protein